MKVTRVTIEPVLEHVIEPWAVINNKEGEIFKFVFGDKFDFDRSDIAYWANEEVSQTTFVIIDDYPAGLTWFPDQEQGMALLASQDPILNSADLASAFPVDMDIDGKGQWCFWIMERGYTSIQFFRNFKDMAIAFYNEDLEGIEDEARDYVAFLRNRTNENLEEFTRKYLQTKNPIFDSLSAFLDYYKAARH